MKNKQYIKLPQISNQKIRQKYYTATSISHPAKAQIPMMHWILKKFVQDGDIVLDPMAGIFTTGVEGMRLFPNSLFIGVELEEKFMKMARANIKKTERIAKKDMFMKIGKSIVVQGDARELEKIMKEKVNKIVTSPPYSGVEAHHDLKFMKKSAEDFTEKVKKGEIKGHAFTSEARKRVFEKAEKGKPENPNNIGNLNYGTADKIISSPPFGQAQSGGGIAKKGYKGSKAPDHDIGKRSYMPENVGSKDNISNLPYGQADKIVTSPPFGGKVQHKTNYLGKQKRESGFEYSDNPENIGNMPHGQIDKVITSPPYSEIRMDGGGKDRAGMKPYTDEPADTWRTQRDQKNIGNLPHGKIDKVITSPPYSGVMDSKRHTDSGICGRDPKMVKMRYADKIVSSPPFEQTISGKAGGPTSEKFNAGGSRKLRNYSDNEDNIGNLKGKTYLGEMLKVYRECFKILKPGGLMILITKDFIRNKKRVRLGEDTIKLCQAAGFTFKEIYYRKIEHPSFWRILYQQKHPEVEKIDSEDILVFEKTSSP